MAPPAPLSTAGVGDVCPCQEEISKAPEEGFPAILKAKQHCSSSWQWKPEEKQGGLGEGIGTRQQMGEVRAPLHFPDIQLAAGPAPRPTHLQHQDF